MIKSKGQQSRSQQAMTQKTGWIQYLRKYFTKIGSHMYLGLFRSKGHGRRRHRVDKSPSSSI